MSLNGKIFSLPSARAEEIIKSLQIREPDEIHIKDIAIERGVFVRERPLDGSEARLVRKGNRGIVTVKDSITEVGRKRFAIAHELGHFELHNTSQLILCTEEDMYFWNESKSQEIEAKEFAASILMPQGIIRSYLKGETPNMNTVQDLAGKFRTTITATTLRYVQLSSEPCAVAISKDRTIKWYKKSTSFDYHIKVGKKLTPNTYASDFYRGAVLPTRPERVPASAWIAGEFDQDAEIFEHSLVLRSYGGGTIIIMD